MKNHKKSAFVGHILATLFVLSIFVGTVLAQSNPTVSVVKSGINKSITATFSGQNILPDENGGCSVINKNDTNWYINHYDANLNLINSVKIQTPANGGNDTPTKDVRGYYKTNNGFVLLTRKSFNAYDSNNTIIWSYITDSIDTMFFTSDLLTMYETNSGYLIKGLGFDYFNDPFSSQIIKYLDKSGKLKWETKIHYGKVLESEWYEAPSQQQIMVFNNLIYMITYSNDYYLDPFGHLTEIPRSNIITTLDTLGSIVSMDTSMDDIYSIYRDSDKKLYNYNVLNHGVYCKMYDSLVLSTNYHHEYTDSSLYFSVGFSLIYGDSVINFPNYEENIDTAFDVKFVSFRTDKNNNIFALIQLLKNDSVFGNMVYKFNLYGDTNHLGIHSEKEDEIVIYPNPSMDYVYIQTPEPCKITLYDMQGKMVHPTMHSNGNIRIERAELPAGIYIINVENKGSIKREKVIFQ